MSFVKPTIGAIAIALMLPACGGVSSQASRCDYDGKTYDDGARFPSQDGCNTCTCDAGKVACTLLACVTGCTYEGEQYAVGATFPASDGCNTCSCSADGTVACTKKACFDCRGISDQYGALFDTAKACSPGHSEECSLRVVAGLVCGCETYVNPKFWDATSAQSLQDSYTSGSCNPGVACGPCAPPTGASCSAQGQCVDTISTDGPACKVGGVVYPNGTGGIPDPTSCNECVCEAGKLACTKKSCPMPCPSSTKLASGCAQCGPTDACEVVETGCMPECSGACSDGFCIDGACVNVCG